MAVVALLAVGGCASGTGFGLNLVGEEQVQEMGLNTWNTIRTQKRVSTNQAYAERARTVGARILRGAGYDPATWEIVVFQGEEVNAFALPGRKIGIYEGMFKVADTPDELAAVIGHEIAHVGAHHAAQRVNTETSTQLGAQLAGVAAGAAGVAPPESVAQVLGTGAKYLVALPYSRNQEIEADRLGLRYMRKAGFNPRAAITLWQKMAKTGGSQGPEFLSTHPEPQRRIEALEAEIAAGGR
jgi:predicted Zn-dependent protease